MRVVNGTIHKNRRKKILKQVKGFRAGRRRLYRTAKDALMKSKLWAYRDRRQKKRQFRRVWIARINAACRQEGISYSRFIYGLNQTNVNLNRKILSELAILKPEVFKQLVQNVKSIQS